MTFKNFVEIGRVAHATNGPEKGKIFAIVDVIDYNRVLIDGPLTGVRRQEYRLMDLHLTNYRIRIQHSQRSKGVKAAWEAANISSRYYNSKAAIDLKKRQRKAELSDFERYQVSLLKSKRNRLIKKIGKETAASHKARFLATLKARQNVQLYNKKLTPEQKAKRKKVAEKLKEKKKKQAKIPKLAVHKRNQYYRAKRLGLPPKPKRAAAKAKPVKGKKLSSSKSKKLRSKKDPKVAAAASGKGKKKPAAAALKAAQKKAKVADKKKKAVVAPSAASKKSQTPKQKKVK